jgi:hypothetical protein
MRFFYEFHTADDYDLVPNARVQNGTTFGAREAAKREGVSRYATPRLVIQRPGGDAAGGN